jgi:hypothetical protein
MDVVVVVVVVVEMVLFIMLINPHNLQKAQQII